MLVLVLPPLRPAELRRGAHQHGRARLLAEDGHVHVHALAERHHGLQVLQVHRDVHGRAPRARRAAAVVVVPQDGVLRGVQRDGGLQGLAHGGVGVDEARQLQVARGGRAHAAAEVVAAAAAAVAVVVLGQAGDGDVVLAGLEVAQQAAELARAHHQLDGHGAGVDGGLEVLGVRDAVHAVRLGDAARAAALQLHGDLGAVAGRLAEHHALQALRAQGRHQVLGQHGGLQGAAPAPAPLFVVHREQVERGALEPHRAERGPRAVHGLQRQPAACRRLDENLSTYLRQARHALEERPQQGAGQCELHD
mmetsp:Transcript_18356/g.45652  ORF Transcript_18356/g.45652 Transcript_18356/m.45652 type:complete len:307 (-) Transcript_18356:134-1054(-)